MKIIIMKWTCSKYFDALNILNQHILIVIFNRVPQPKNLVNYEFAVDTLLYNTKEIYNDLVMDLIPTL